MKVITQSDVSLIPVDRVVPGHMVLQGIVLAVNAEDMDGAGWLETATASVYVEAGHLVAVYGKVTDDMVEGIRSAVNRPHRGVNGR